MNQVTNMPASEQEGKSPGGLARFLAIIHSKGITLFCRLFVGALFAIGAVAKLQDIRQYSVNAVYEYGLLPVEPVDIAAAFGYVLPFLELGVGLALLFGLLTRLASLGGALLGLSFAAGEGIVLLQGRDINCGCFGGLVGTMMSVTIYLSAFMVIFGLLVYTSPNRNFCSLTNVFFKDRPNIPKILRSLS
ncbi:MAG: DoxX family membrane protein [Negativicutes bacterium]|nr:DoxX family membrane protein [Negativicutes bacterium]